MTNFAKFLSVNGLKRKDIANYLGVSGAFITQISSGDRNLPEEKLATIKTNAYGWDISMLVQPENPMTDEPKEDAYIAHLKQEIADLKATIERLQNERCDLREEIGTLKKEVQLARKGEIASIAVGSSDADAV